MAIEPPTDEEKKLMDLLKMPAGNTDFKATIEGAVTGLVAKGALGKFEQAQVKDFLERAEKETYAGNILDMYQKILQRVQQPLVWQLGLGRKPDADIGEATITGQRVWELYMKD